MDLKLRSRVTASFEGHCSCSVLERQLLVVICLEASHTRNTAKLTVRVCMCQCLCIPL